MYKKKYNQVRSVLAGFASAYFWILLSNLDLLSKKLLLHLILTSI